MTQVMPRGLGFGGEIRLKNISSLTCYTINLCIKAGLNTFFHISSPWQVCLVVQSHTIVSMYVLGGVVQRRKYVPLLGRIQNGVLSLWSVWVFWKPDRNIPDRNIPMWMERKDATEYSTAEKMGVLKMTMAWAIRAWRPHKTANM